MLIFSKQYRSLVDTNCAYLDVRDVQNGCMIDAVSGTNRIPIGRFDSEEEAMSALQTMFDTADARDTGGKVCIG